MEPTYAQIPHAWPICFLNQCPRQNECLRHRIGLVAPSDLYFTLTVTPLVLKEKDCPMFRKIEIMRVARGFSGIFAEVKAVDIRGLRRDLMNYLRGHTNYYRYLHGERVLTPEQQSGISDIFRGYGYSETLTFDAYEEQFRFDP